MEKRLFKLSLKVTLKRSYGIDNKWMQKDRQTKDIMHTIMGFDEQKINKLH